MRARGRPIGWFAVWAGSMPNLRVARESRGSSERTSRHPAEFRERSPEMDAEVGEVRSVGRGLEYLRGVARDARSFPRVDRNG
jgi:hypothetical protein